MGNDSQVDEHRLDFKHNIRNPLYSAKSLIESHLEYLESSQEDQQQISDKTKKVLSKSKQAIERALKIIHKLNELSVSSQESLPTETVCVKEILHRVLEALSGAHYLDHVLLVQSIVSDLPPLKVNLIDLEEIFFNLIVNAAQATQKGATLFIQAVYQMDPSSMIISFRDTGCGISEEALPYIFEPFYTGRSNEGGVGFGLYIVKQLIERNRGSISVESKVGRGTVFTLTFPVKPN